MENGVAFVGPVSGGRPKELVRRQGSANVANTTRQSSAVRCSAAAPGGASGGGESEAKNVLERNFSLTLTANEHEGKNGECQCIFCNGSGKRKCSWCKGAGQRKELMDLSWEEMGKMFDDMKAGKRSANLDSIERVPVVCSACKGTTLLRCGFCQGKGTGSYGFAY